MRARGRMGEEAMHLFIAVPTQPPVAHWSPAEKEGSTPETGIWFRRRQKMVSTVFRVELAAPEHKRGSIHVRARGQHHPPRHPPGEPGRATPPRLAMRSLIFASAIARFTSLLSNVMISGGVPFGAQRPLQASAR